MSIKPDSPVELQDRMAEKGFSEGQTVAHYSRLAGTGDGSWFGFASICISYPHQFQYCLFRIQYKFARIEFCEPFERIHRTCLSGRVCFFPVALCIADFARLSHLSGGGV